MTNEQASAIALVIQVAKAYKWVKEDPRHTNRGEAVTEFLKLTGLDAGQPWCMAYLSACGHWALEGTWPLPMTASTDQLLAFARAHHLLYDTPEPGDIGLLLHSPTDAHHAVLVVDLDVDPKVYHTIEGNTNDNGSDDGYEVLEKDRTITPGKQVFVRWCELLT